MYWRKGRVLTSPASVNKGWLYLDIRATYCCSRRATRSRPRRYIDLPLVVSRCVASPVPVIAELVRDRLWKKHMSLRSKQNQTRDGCGKNLLNAPKRCQGGVQSIPITIALFWGTERSEGGGCEENHETSPQRARTRTLTCALVHNAAFTADMCGQWRDIQRDLPPLRRLLFWFEEHLSNCSCAFVQLFLCQTSLLCCKMCLTYIEHTSTGEAVNWTPTSAMTLVFLLWLSKFDWRRRLTLRKCQVRSWDIAIDLCQEAMKPNFGLFNFWDLNKVFWHMQSYSSLNYKPNLTSLT